MLSGGEVAAMVALDGICRLLPGVFGNKDSGQEESFENGLLEYPHYTRPVEWQGLEVPEILRSGDHRRIREWRLQEAQEVTKSNRFELWEEYKSQM